MTGAIAGPPARPSYRRITAIGLALLAALAVLVGTSEHWNARVQGAWFDTFQTVQPRTLADPPVTVVEIDEKSLARLGQWPWPRTRLAELIGAVLKYGPAAVGVDILMPEPDRLSPERLLARERERDPMLAERLAALPSSDEELARAIAGQPVVLGFVEAFDRTARAPRGPPIRTIERPGRSPGPDAAANLSSLPGVLANVAVLDTAAAGRGALSIGAPETVVRRIPLVMRVDGQVVPSIAIELLRVARTAPDVRLYVDGPAVDAVGVGGHIARTEADGGLRLHYTPRATNRLVSAVDVLDGEVDGRRIAGKLVLIGSTALALGDYHPTPLAPMPGVEIHAQLLENIVGQSWLARPAWAPRAELALFVALGLALIAFTPRLRPGRGALVATGCIVLPILVGAATFVTWRLVFDGATPALALLLLYVALLVLTLAETARQRRRLEQTVQRQREEAARVAGELEAARRIQQGFLPRADVLRDDRRLEVAVAMTPARETGGDLYDFFMLDARRLFFMVGDVAGKGLSASVFMAVSKALCKSAILRNPEATIGELLRAANVEISRDNPAMLFVAAFAGILDLDRGELAYCNAGHENPYVLTPSPPALDRLAAGDGPPLCTVARFGYLGAVRTLRSGELVCVLTDGVVEAQRRDGERYGRERLEAKLTHLPAGANSAEAVVAALTADVADFSTGADPADDITILVLRWLGPT